MESSSSSGEVVDDSGMNGGQAAETDGSLS